MAGREADRRMLRCESITKVNRAILGSAVQTLTLPEHLQASIHGDWRGRPRPNDGKVLRVNVTSPTTLRTSDVPNRDVYLQERNRM